MSPSHDVTRDSWKQILASAVAIFEDLEGKGFGNPDVVIGGGTVLMFRFEHRLSKDIDFFMHDVQWLSLLAPRLNDTVAAMVADYVEQPNGIKLVLPHGDIDFVVARPVTEAKAVATLEFMGRTFLLESTEEILAKKLFYRAARFQPRDVFDLVVAAELDGRAAARAVVAAASRKDVVSRSLERMLLTPIDELPRQILPLGDFYRIIPTMIEKAQRLLQDSLGH
jgi:predicted nucleotidyltransferase component of viral defense system